LGWFSNHPTPPQKIWGGFQTTPPHPKKIWGGFKTTPPHPKKIEVVSKPPHLKGGVVGVIYNPGREPGAFSNMHTRVDIDKIELREIALQEEVRTFPTVSFYQSGLEVVLKHLRAKISISLASFDNWHERE
jgi:hypothetical protein